MNTIEICNLRNEKCVYPYDVRVDRSSILGNPYYMNGESERDEVCNKYQAYFNEKYENSEAFKNEVSRLISIYKRYGHLRLFCWCYPKRCHAMYIRKMIEIIMENEND